MKKLNIKTDTDDLLEAFGVTDEKDTENFIVLQKLIMQCERIPEILKMVYEEPSFTENEILLIFFKIGAFVEAERGFKRANSFQTGNKTIN